MHISRRDPHLVSRESHRQLPDIWTTFAASGIVLDPPRPQMAAGPPRVAEDLPLRHAHKRKQFKRTMFTEGQRQILLKWLIMHQANPYPTAVEKELLMEETGLHKEQINIWFTNNRIRQGFTTAHRLDEHRAAFPPPLRI
jgi:hypothetical protein